MLIRSSSAGAIHRTPADQHSLALHAACTSPDFYTLESGGEEWPSEAATCPLKYPGRTLSGYMGSDQDSGDQPRCMFWVPSMDHPCQRQVPEPHHVCHMHPPEDLEEQPRCGFEKEDGSFCRMERSREDAGTFCHLHPPEEADLGETRGAPEGNDFAEGNPGGGPPEGNTNALKHGLRTSAERLLEAMPDELEDSVKHRFVEYRDKCLNDSRAWQLAVQSVFMDYLAEETLEKVAEDGFTRTKYTDEGHEYEDFIGDDIQAWQALDREVRLGLHYEGNSAQHTGGGGAAHDNLGMLVESESD